jgi:HNH endonuclease
MAISERTRKMLWGKAGGRCSICRVQLIADATTTDEPPSVLGEEAHIIPRADGGPDTYANLILLCSMHHKQVDDQREHYTIERLKKLKQKHESWISSQGGSADVGPVRLIPDPFRPTSKFLRLFVFGTALRHFFEGAYSFYPSFPDGLSAEHEHLIDSFLDDLRDGMDVSGELDSYQERRNVCRVMDDHIKRLAEAGFVVGAREKFLLLTGGADSPPSSWRSIEIEVQPFSDTQLVDAGGKPVDLRDIISQDAGT